MDPSLSEWISLYQWPGGRRELAQRQVAELADAEGFNDIASHCRAAVEHEQRLRHRQRELATVQQARVNPRLTALDPQIDRTIGSVYRIASEAPATLDGDTAKQARHLVETVFPRGAAAITHLTYVEQSAEVQSVLGILQGQLKQTVHALGLDPYVAQLAKLSDEFAAVLAKEPRTAITPDQVRAEAAQGQERLLKTVALILGRCSDSSEEHIARRARLLRPIAVQQDAMRAYLRSRRAVRDVDPQTGAETPEEPAPQPVPVPVPVP